VKFLEVVIRRVYMKMADFFGKLIQTLGRTIIENCLVRAGYPRVYIHMVDIILKPRGTLRIVIYHHALQPTSTIL